MRWEVLGFGSPGSRQPTRIHQTGSTSAPSAGALQAITVARAVASSFFMVERMDTGGHRRTDDRGEDIALGCACHRRVGCRARSAAPAR